MAGLLAYGREHGLFVRREDGSEHTTLLGSNGWQRVVTLDFTNPEAVRW